MPDERPNDTSIVFVPDSNGYQAGPGTVVVVSYEIFDAEGDFIESSDHGDPLSFLFGYCQVAPALERAVEGLFPGQARRVRLSPDEAFGRRDPQAILEVDRADFPADVSIGDELCADADSGGLVVLKVVDMTDDVVIVDTNHPLAGQDVEIDLVVESVRAASSRELDEADRALESGDAAGPQSLLSAERLLKRSVGRPEPTEPPPTSNRVA